MSLKTPKAKPAKPTRVSLRELIDQYLLERETSKGYREQIEVAFRMLKDWHGKIVYVDDFADDFINRFLANEATKGLKPETLKNRRRLTLCLWRYAWDRELIAEPPRRVRKIKSAPIIPVAWSAEEVLRLVQAADGFCIYHVHRTAKVYTGLFWKALIMVVWDTGLRRVDWERLKRSDIGPDGTIYLVQHKTNWPLRCTLRAETIAAIDAINPANREFVFGSGGSTRTRSFKRLVKAAGLVGSLKKLRKSSATAAERLQPGAATAHLGHKTPGLAARHYIDPRMVQATKLQPPSLEPTPAPVEKPQTPGGDILAWI